MVGKKYFESICKTFQIKGDEKLYRDCHPMFSEEAKNQGHCYVIAAKFQT